MAKIDIIKLYIIYTHYITLHGFTYTRKHEEENTEEEN